MCAGGRMSGRRAYQNRATIPLAGAGRDAILVRPNMSTVYDIGVLPGDGIGEEVVNEALKVLDAVQSVYGFETKREAMPYGAEHYLATGETMPDAAFDRVRDMHAVLFGAIGDPRIEVGKLEFAIIAGMRHKLDLFVNLRPVKLYHESMCPLKGKTPADIDIMFCRENTEDAYAGIHGTTKKGSPNEIALQQMVYTRRGTERIIRYAFELAKKRGRPEARQGQAAGHPRRQGQRRARAGHLDARVRRGRGRVSRHRHRPRLHRRGVHVDGEEPGVVRRRRDDQPLR